MFQVQIATEFDGVNCRLGAFTVPQKTFKPATLCPAAIAVHDDCHMSQPIRHDD